MKTLNIIIPLNPTTKKNSSRIVKSGAFHKLIPSKQYIEYEKKCKRYLPILNQPISDKINLKCVYYMQTKHKVDLTNLLNATCDMLVKHNVLEDDNSNIVYSHDGSYVDYDKLNPRVEIEIRCL